MADPEKKYRVTEYILEPTNGLGQYVTRPFNLMGEPFVVFCSSPTCEHYVEAEFAFPHWSEDCPENLGVLRCVACGAPVIRPRGPDQ